MKVTILSDNIGCGALKGEWGLSFHMEFNGRRYLLDTGDSALFLRNAEELGISIADVDCAVLSHAHYDHSLGMEAFFRTNSKADFFVSPNARENCYSGPGLLKRYIGLPKGLLRKYRDRIKTPSGVTEIDKDVFIIPHSGDGLVIFNSCSHSGADIVMDEVGRAFPGEQVKAYLGGLHLFRMDETEVREMARKIRDAGIHRVITGHCTGDMAFAVLKSCLGESMDQFHCGMVIDV